MPKENIIPRSYFGNPMSDNMRPLKVGQSQWKKEKRGKKDKWGVRNLEEFGIGNSWWMRGIRMCLLLAGLLLAQKTAVYNTTTTAKNTCEWPAIRFVSTTPGWRSSRRKRRIDPPVRLYSPSFLFLLFFYTSDKKEKKGERRKTVLRTAEDR